MTTDLKISVEIEQLEQLERLNALLKSIGAELEHIDSVLKELTKKTAPSEGANKAPGVTIEASYCSMEDVKTWLEFAKQMQKEHSCNCALLLKRN